MSTNLDNDDIDLSMRAPYIPMNENDDLPLLTEDLMWSAFSDELSLHKDMKDATLQQQLLLQQQQQHQHQQQMQTNLMMNMNSNNNVIDVNNVVVHTNGVNGSATKYAASNARLAKDASNLADMLSSNAYSTEHDKRAALLSDELMQSHYQSHQNENANIKYQQQQQQQSAAKTVNAKCIRSHMPLPATTSTATTTAPIINNNNNNSSSKMEVIDSVDGSITTYTIEMLDDDAYSKNCKCHAPNIPKSRYSGAC